MKITLTRNQQGLIAIVVVLLVVSGILFGTGTGEVQTNTAAKSASSQKTTSEVKTADNKASAEKTTNKTTAKIKANIKAKISEKTVTKQVAVPKSLPAVKVVSARSGPPTKGSFNQVTTVTQSGVVYATEFRKWSPSQWQRKVELLKEHGEEKLAVQYEKTFVLLHEKKTAQK